MKDVFEFAVFCWMIGLALFQSVEKGNYALASVAFAVAFVLFVKRSKLE